MNRIGYHISIAGSMDLAFDRAKEIGCTCMQIFLSNPRGWAMKELSDEEIKQFRAKQKSFGISPVFAHMPYLPNLASPKEDVYKKSVDALRGILRRCEALEVKYLIAHLGSNLGTDKQSAIDRVCDAVRKTGAAAGGITILLENEAGQNNSVGSTTAELVEIYNGIGIKNLGFCIDTCHLFVAGLDIRKKEVASDVIDTLGSSRIKAIHLNDAKYPLGSRLDRHADVGFGHIGSKGLVTFLAHSDMVDKPMIMETPLVELKLEAKAGLRIVKKLISSISD